MSREGERAWEGKKKFRRQSVSQSVKPQWVVVSERILLLLLLLHAAAAAAAREKKNEKKIEKGEKGERRAEQWKKEERVEMNFFEKEGKSIYVNLILQTKSIYVQ